MSRSKEAFWWSLFSAGGVMSALFIPALIIVTGFILPFTTGPDTSGQYEHVLSTTSIWFVRLILFGVFMLAFFHCLHRIRHVLMDLGLRQAPLLLSVVCYGVAVAGTIITGVVLIRF